MDIIYHSMPITWKNKIIEQGLNYADTTVKEMKKFYETRVEHVERKEDKKKYSVVIKKLKDKKSANKRK